MRTSNFDQNGSSIGLAEMIQTLREELEFAQGTSDNSDIIFETEKIELELKMAITKKATGKAGIQFWVVQAGGDYENSGATTHSFKLTLKPTSKATGNRTQVSATTTRKPSDD